MRSSLISILIFSILAFSGAAFGQTKYSTYSNPRFGYEIDYPSDLLKIQPPDFSGDGRIFLSNDGTVEMRVWANYNATFLSVQGQFDEDLQTFGAGVTYKRLFNNGFVFSGVRKGKIFYQKTLYHKFKETDVFYTFTIEYPKSRKSKFDSMVEHIANSFSFDPNAEV